jgi:hypothetical protein
MHLTALPVGQRIWAPFSVFIRGDNRRSLADILRSSIALSSIGAVPLGVSICNLEQRIGKNTLTLRWHPLRKVKDGHCPTQIQPLGLEAGQRRLVEKGVIVPEGSN